jgi:hypothetical protein
MLIGPGAARMAREGSGFFRTAGRLFRHVPGLAQVSASGPNAASIRARTASRSIPMDASASRSRAQNRSAAWAGPGKADDLGLHGLG